MTERGFGVEPWLFERAGDLRMLSLSHTLSLADTRELSLSFFLSCTLSLSERERDREYGVCVCARERVCVREKEGLGSDLGRLSALAILRGFLAPLFVLDLRH